MMSGWACSMLCILSWPWVRSQFGHLRADLLEPFKLAEHALVAVGPRGCVVVGGLAQEFDVVALFADHLHPLLSAQGGALRVVGNELPLGQARFVDLGVDE